MDQSEDIRTIFREEQQDNFDFSAAPALVTSKRGATVAFDNVDPTTASRWRKIQNGFLERAKVRDKYPSKKLEQVRARYTTLFRERGLLRGTVLDIGGGWGLHREWWERGEAAVYIVHDPGVERFIKGAHAAHYECYQRAFDLPMTFVEGVGETLPYKDDLFDTCLIAATLDHCADPRQVLAEAYRCLKPGGRMIILQTCDAPRTRRFRALVGRVIRYLRRPGQLLSRLCTRTLGPPTHMHGFVAKQLTAILEEAGFSNVHTWLVHGAVQMFEAFKVRA